MKAFMTYGPADELYRAARKLLLGQADNGALQAAVDACDVAIKDRKTFKKQVAQAREQATNDLEIDDDPVLSISDDGVWVSAWLWVPR